MTEPTAPAAKKDDTAKSGKSLQEQYVPFEQRESQNTKMKDWAIEAAKFIIVTKVAAVAGAVLAETYAKKSFGQAFNKVFKTSIFKKMGDPEYGKSAEFIGGTLGGVAGATYEAYGHWSKQEGNRLAASSIHGSVREAIDLDQIKREADKETAIVNDLQKLDKALNKTNHAERITARREEAAASTEKQL